MATIAWQPLSERRRNSDFFNGIMPGKAIVDVDKYTLHKRNIEKASSQASSTPMHKSRPIRSNTASFSVIQWLPEHENQVHCTHSPAFVEHLPIYYYYYNFIVPVGPGQLMADVSAAVIIDLVFIVHATELCILTRLPLFHVSHWLDQLFEKVLLLLNYIIIIIIYIYYHLQLYSHIKATASDITQEV